MGLYNSVFIACPKCKELNEDQHKPGMMNGWRFPEQVTEIPTEYLEDLNEREFHCHNCQHRFVTRVEIEIKIGPAYVCSPDGEPNE